MYSAWNIVCQTKLCNETYVRSGIRTHAHRCGLRPERSALDRSAILTHAMDWGLRRSVGHIGLKDIFYK